MFVATSSARAAVILESVPVTVIEDESFEPEVNVSPAVVAKLNVPLETVIDKDSELTFAAWSKSPTCNRL